MNKPQCVRSLFFIIIYVFFFGLDLSGLFAEPARRIRSQELNFIYRKAILQKKVVKTFDPFLDILTALSWGFSRSDESLLLTRTTFHNFLEVQGIKTDFTDFIENFIEIHFHKRIVTTRLKKSKLELEIPNSFGTYLAASNNFVLKITNPSVRTTEIEVDYTKTRLFQLRSNAMGRLRGIKDIYIKKLILERKRNQSETYVFSKIYGKYLDEHRGSRKKYLPWVIEAELTTLGTLTGLKFVKGYAP